MRAHQMGRLPVRGARMVGDSKRVPAALTLLVLSLALCTDCRELLQTQQQPAQASQLPTSLASAPSTALSAPSTALTAAQQDAGSPLTSAGPLPAGVVSLAKKKGKKNSNQADLSAAVAAAPAAAPASPGVYPGDYTPIAGINNAGTGQLPGGYSYNQPKMSASQLAAAQAAAATNAKADHSLANDVTQVVGSKVTQADAAAVESSLGEQVVVHPTDMAARTVQQVNSNAPDYTAPSGVTVKPQLATASQGGVKQRTTTAAGKPLNGVQSTSGLDSELITGDYISTVVGVRIATPLFGTGFNFCIDRYFGSFPVVGIVIPNTMHIDRYFGSFPVVGIVIPNAGAWLLPEFQDLAEALEHTLDLPTILPHGARVDPTSDGFLLWLPTFQPSEVPDFGIRYGIQIGQSFGYDFGLGVIRDICFISFVIV